MQLNKTQVVKSSDLVGGAVVMAWILGVIVPIVFSILGNYVMFMGNTWEAFSLLTMFNETLFYACVWQVVSTLAQFFFKSAAKTNNSRGFWIAYIMALLVSVIPSFVAYYALVSPSTLPQLQSSGIPDMIALPLLAMIVLLVCFVADMVPEWIIVEGT